jgi:hypothetical protein
MSSARCRRRLSAVAIDVFLAFLSASFAGTDEAEGSVGQWHFGKRRPSGADHEEQPPELIGLDAARSWRCRGASCPHSRPDLSRRLEPALKPLCSRAVRTVAWNPVRGCSATATCGRTLDRVGDAVRTATMGAPGHGREKCAPVHACGNKADASDSHQSHPAHLLPQPARHLGSGGPWHTPRRAPHAPTAVTHPATCVSRPGIHRSTCREDASASGPRGPRRRPSTRPGGRFPVRCR